MKTTALVPVVLLFCASPASQAQNAPNIVIGGSGKPAVTSNVTLTKNSTLTSVVTSNNTTASADAEWRSVEKLFVPLTPANAQGRITVERQAAQFLQASLLAKSFQVRYPRDPRLAEARKLEALGALQAAQLAGTQYAASAVPLGTAFRNDRRNAVKDRVEVAVAMEAVSARGRAGGKPLVEDTVQAASFADRLFAEFGDDEEAHHVVRGLMLASDAPTALALSAKINQRNGPPWAKDDAQKVNDRALLPQRLIAPALAGAGILPTQLGSITSEPTVLFFWGKNGREIDMAALGTIRGAVSGRAKWIYVGLGVPANQAAIDQPPFAGTFLGLPAEFRSPLAAELNVTRTPWVCVLDKTGKVAGAGRVKDLPALLSEAAK